MKYIVLIVVLVVVWMLWRNSERRAERSRPPPPAAPPAANPASPQDMVRCPVCALHLPQSDALAGPAGQVYCSVEHARSAGG